MKPLISYLNYKFDNLNKNYFLFFLHPKVLLYLGIGGFIYLFKLVTGKYSGDIDDSELEDCIFLHKPFKEKPLCLFKLPKRKSIVLKIPLLFKDEKTPLVSIIIPVYNKWNYTFNCLRAISQNTVDISYEIIIIDDNSTDCSESIFQNISGLRYFKNIENIGFLKSCNKGADIAIGKYLCFLNNDTQVQERWLKALMSVFENNEKAGLAGSKFIYPSGLLQEAGGIIWKDATGCNFGRMQSPSDPTFNFTREVDYCSGASIVISKELFFDLGKFDERFVPAYYEDTDLCFKVRSRGKKVIFEPKSVVVHFEGISSGTSLDEGVKSFQRINHEKFYTKWKGTLENHFSSEDILDFYPAALRLVSPKTILVVDDYVPRFDRESGSNRLLSIVKMFVELGYHVIFVPDNCAAEEPYTSMLQQMGVEVLYDIRNKPALLSLKEKIAFLSIAWICRPALMSKYLPVIKENKKIKIIYDTIDLHYLRLEREEEIRPDTSIEIGWWKKMKALEEDMANQADLVVTITDKEKEILAKSTSKPIKVVPNIHNPKTSNNAFEARKDLLFIGSYKHLPNIDAAIWLVHEVMPLVWKINPSIKLTLLGSSPTKEVIGLKNEKVDVTGYIPNVEPYFKSHRIFVCPLRYGAGMKGKIGQSLEFALPIVSTSIGVEGMPMENGVHYLEANIPADFAAQIIKLYSNPVLWNTLSLKSKSALVPYSFTFVKSSISDILEEVSVDNLEVEV